MTTGLVYTAPTVGDRRYILMDRLQRFPWVHEGKMEELSAMPNEGKKKNVGEKSF